MSIPAPAIGTGANSNIEQRIIPWMIALRYIYLSTTITPMVLVAPGAATPDIGVSYSIKFLRISWRASEVDTGTLPLGIIIIAILVPRFVMFTTIHIYLPISLLALLATGAGLGINIPFVRYEPLKLHQTMLIGLLNHYFWQHHIAMAPTIARYRSVGIISCPTRQTT